MKRSEIAMIILIASLSMLFTFTLAQSLLGDKIKRKVSVEQTEAISKELEQPAKRVFNKQAINPTVEVCVEQTQLDGETNSDDDCQGSDVETDTATEDTTDATTDISANPSSSQTEATRTQTNN